MLHPVPPAGLLFPGDGDWPPRLLTACGGDETVPL